MKRHLQSPVLVNPAANTGPFPYADYVAARDTLNQALRSPQRFYATLTGASGMGKTCLLRELSESLDRHRYNVVYLSSSRASVIGVARFIAQKLHLGARRCYLETVSVLGDAIAAQQTHLLLWVDEADQVDMSVLQEIRMLAESALGSEQLFSLVFSGMPALLARLEMPALFPLKRRISRRLVLTGLRRDELDAFLLHRFGAEQTDRVDPGARDELFERTQATPAIIDSVLRHALERHKAQIDKEAVRAILDTQGL